MRYSLFTHTTDPPPLVGKGDYRRGPVPGVTKRRSGTTIRGSKCRRYFRAGRAQLVAVSHYFGRPPSSSSSSAAYVSPPPLVLRVYKYLISFLAPLLNFRIH